MSTRPRPTEGGREGEPPSETRLRLGLLVKSIRWRAGSSVVFLVVAVAAVGAATAGPLYLASADQAVLDSALRGTTVQQTSVSITSQPGIGATALTREVGSGPLGPGGVHWFGAPLVTEDVGATVGSGPKAVLADIVWRTEICAHLRFVSGSCPSGPDQVALSTRSARFIHAETGSRLALHAARGGTETVAVSGLYEPVDPQGSYFSGTNFLPFGTGSVTLPRIDALVAQTAAIAQVAPDSLASSLELPLAAGRLRSTDVPAFETALSSMETHLGTALNLQVTSELPTLLHGVASQQHSLRTSVIVIEVQLLLLVLLVLYSVSVRAAEERRQELALADLRGLPTGSLAWLACREAAALTLLAVPLGLLVGWVVIAGASKAAFGAASITVDSLAVVACVAGGLGAMLASAVASLNVVRRRDGTTAAVRVRRGEAIAALGLDAAVVALALAALTQLNSSGVGGTGQTQPLAAAAPALVALALAVVVARLVPLAASAAGRATQLSPKLALNLSSNRLARSASILRQSVVLALAVSLSVFAVVAFLVASRNRSVQSSFQVGAPEVLSVRAPATLDFVAATRRADPSGHEAMAAQVLHSPSGSLLGVDASRFAAVASWPGGLSPVGAAAVGRYLAPRTAPEVLLTGTTASLTLDDTTALRPAPRVVLSLFNLQFGALEPVSLGPLRHGTHTYRASLLGTCVPRCRLVSMSVSWPPAAENRASGVARLRLESFAVGNGAGATHEVAGLFSSPRNWRVTSGNVLTGADPAAGLSTTWTLAAGAPPPVLAVADVPAVLPAVVTDTVAAANAGAGPTGSTQYSAENLDGSSVTVDGRVQVPALPELGSAGILVNLPFALRAEQQEDVYSTDQVWLASSAPSKADPVIRRLEAAGITVVAATLASDTGARLAHSGPALAFALFIFAAVAGAVLAATSLLYAISVMARRRSIEMVALEAAGLRRRTTVGALRLELGMVALTGLVVGLAAGVLSAHLALPSIPEFAAAWHVPILGYGQPFGAILLTAVALGVVFAAALAVGIRLITRKATPDKLRMSQR